MQNILDVFSRYRVKVSESMSQASDIVSAFSDAYDLFPEVFFQKGYEMYENLSLFLVDNFNTLVDNLAGKTITLDSGHVFSFSKVESFIQEWDQRVCNLKYSIGALRDVSLFTWEFNPLLPLSSSMSLEFEGLFNSDGQLDMSLSDIFFSIADNFSINDVINRAMGLVEKGQLTVSNFMSSINDIAAKARSKTKEVIEAIKEACGQATLTAQATGLLTVLRGFFSSASSATVDDTKGIIKFNDTQFSINTSLCFPLNQVIYTASNVLSTITTIISPIIGRVIDLVSKGVSNVIQAINSNDSDKWKIISEEQADNGAFAVPFVQTTLNLSAMPQMYKSKLEEYGFIKLTNALFTLYVWISNDQIVDPEVSVEGYVNIYKTDLTYNNENTDLFYNQMISKVRANGVAGVVVENLNTVQNDLYNINVWLNDQVNPGGDAPAITKIQSTYGLDQFEKLLLRRVALSTGAIISLLLDSEEFDGEYNWNILDYITGRSNDSVNECWHMLVSFLGELSTDISLWTNLYSTINSQALVGLVNNVFPAMRDLFSRLSTNSIVNILFNFGINEDEYDTRDGLGAGYNYVVSYIVCNHANALVYPPSSTVSIWARVAFAAISVAAVGVTSAILVSKVKKHLAFKATQSRREISDLLDSDPLTYDNWNEARKMTRKYNLFYGKLTGSSYDMANEWIDYSEQGALNSSSIISSFIPDNDDPNAEGLLKINDSNIVKLIKGE